MQKLLADYRREAGFGTQEAFSSAVGVERATVAKWETGERHPRVPMIPHLAALLNVTEGEIIAAIMAAKNKNTA